LVERFHERAADDPGFIVAWEGVDHHGQLEVPAASSRIVKLHNQLLAFSNTIPLDDKSNPTERNVPNLSTVTRSPDESGNQGTGEVDFVAGLPATLPDLF
jgi:hypothetical protein